MRVGDKVEIGLLRDGKSLRLTAVITDNSMIPEQAAGTSEAIHSGLEGAALQDAPDSGGALVRSIEPGSTAAQSGLKSNDIIVGANQRRVTSVQQLRDRAKGSSVVVLEIRRGNAILLIPLR
jgi:S1-C subfamily serine protease